ncbi:MAG: CDP-alcohol phosphatidyltransferase family protein [Pseudomonadota bacterium]
MVANERLVDAGGIGVHQIPNLLSILRIIAVGPIVWYLHREAYSTALLIAFVASATDGLDGYLARRFDWRSRIGGLLDPLADKLLQVSCYVMLTWQGFLPWWLLALVIGRDVVIVAGALAYQLLVDRVSGEPTGVSKVNTILQLCLILWVLLDLSLLPLPQAGFATLMAAVALTTVISGIQYVGIWGRRALASRG